MTEEKKIPEWIQKRSERHASEPESEYFKIPEGETVILVNEQQAPEEIKGKFGDQAIYEIFIEGEKQKLSASRRLDRLIIKALMNGMNPMTLVRVGKEIDTRYAIKGLE